MKDIKSNVQSQFGATAENYRHSQVHATGADLIWLAQQVSDASYATVLDAGCGAGHVSVTLAPHVENVVSLDLTEAMLEQVTILANERNLDNITTKLGDVEALPFDDATFDLVVTRYSAHHWADPAQAVSEIKRVLKPSGRFILIDIVGYENFADDTFLQTIELLRDLSHVRDHTINQWRGFLETVGFTVQKVDQWELELNFDAWTTRMAVPEQRLQVIRNLFETAPDPTRELLQYNGETLALKTALFDAHRQDM